MKPTGRSATPAGTRTVGCTAVNSPKAPSCIEPPVDHPARRSMELYDQLNISPDPADQRALMGQILDIAAENLWTLSICTSPDYVVVVKNGLRNVPRRVIYTYDFVAPQNAAPETWSWDAPKTTKGTDKQILAAIKEVTEAPYSAGGAEQQSATDTPAAGPSAPSSPGCSGSRSSWASAPWPSAIPSSPVAC